MALIPLVSETLENNHEEVHVLSKVPKSLLKMNLDSKYLLFTFKIPKAPVK